MTTPLLPRLTARTVQVRSPGGQPYDVPLLPAAMYDQVMAAASPSMPGEGGSPASVNHKTYAHVCAGLRAILKTVWPPEHTADLLSLSAEGLFTVARRLLQGEPSPELPRGEEGGQPVDFEFVCAKVMQSFPSYTLDALLAEPIPVISHLFRLAERLDTWNALHRDFPASVAAAHGGKALAALERDARHAITPEPTAPHTTGYTEEQLQQSVANIERAKHKPPTEVVAWPG